MKTITFDEFIHDPGWIINKDMGKRGRVQCADSFSISIQRNSYAYCDLHDGFANHIYPMDMGNTTYELGFPSEEDSLIIEYAEEPDNPTDTVYGYVPYGVVIDLLDKHGGITHVWSAEDLEWIPVEFHDVKVGV